MTIFDEKYKVVAVESQSLVIRGVLSGGASMPQYEFKHVDDEEEDEEIEEEDDKEESEDEDEDNEEEEYI